MFESIRLTNFQTHRSLKIDFDPHVTTITGPSDKGKSAIIRAIRWVCSNRPNGDAFIHHSAEHVSVRLWVDGNSIIRAKGKGLNSYKLNKQEYVAFGNEVPIPIASLLNISEVNFQEQHDAPFWFSETPGQVSRSLNQIINLGVIDDSLAAAASDLRKTKATIGVIEDRLTKALEQRELVANAPDIDRSLRKLEAKFDRIEKLRSKIAGLSRLITKVNRHGDRQRNLEESRTTAQDAILLAQKAVDLSERSKVLETLVTDITKARATASITIPNIGELHSDAKKFISLNSKISKLRETIRQAEFQEHVQWERRNQLARVEKELSEVKSCPACGSRMK